MSKKKLSHILNTSSNLLGFCFIVITSLKISNRNHQTFIDEVLIVDALIFMTSSIFSFLSLRNKTEYRIYLLEQIAEYFFIAGLSILFIVIVLIAFDML
ncbi:MAG: hypothetical protein M3Q05_10940 [Bacteroidota bacterium]|nr:hypothetical protein [Bacteroidota bacterium]